MAEIKVSGNYAQLPKLCMAAKYEVSVEGRGTGKSFDIGFKMDQLVRQMPGAVIALTGKSYGQLLTRTLPSSLKLLNSMGVYQKDATYVIGKKPPPEFKKSYEAINKFDNVISFSNGTCFAMISQSEAGSGRGANVDYEIVDEALLIDREQYNNEVAPTNRGNNEFFGRKSKNPVYCHHGYKYSTSMPVSKEGRWVLEYADYYQREKGVKLFSLWNRIVTMQVGFLDVVRAYKEAQQGGSEAQMIEAKAESHRQWLEIKRLKARVSPFVSKGDVLFTLSNAFDNIEMLGINYLLDNQTKLPYLIFMTEIMNMYYDKVEDCFYSLSEAKHIYYDSYDNEKIRDAAASNNYSLTMNYDSSIYDRDCDPNSPIEIAFDWGSSICLMVVDQERRWDFVNNCASEQRCQTQINEFFVKPDKSDGVMIKDLIGKFTAYYREHRCKTVYYYKDKYGDHRNPNILNSRTFNEMAYEELQRAGWTVIVKEHRGMEPPQSDKYNLWGFILSEQSKNLPLFRINGNKCKYTLISMNNARVKTVEGQLKKDKSSERPTSGVLPEEATHFSDARDKLIWTKYGEETLHRRGEGYTRI